MERSKQGHGNKLADSCGENKGRRQLDNIAVPIWKKLSAGHRVWAALKGLKGGCDPHPLTWMISRSNDVSVVTQGLGECKDENISLKEQSEKLNVICLSSIKTDCWAEK